MACGSVSSKIGSIGSPHCFKSRISEEIAYRSLITKSRFGFKACFDHAAARMDAFLPNGLAFIQLPIACIIQTFRAKNSGRFRAAFLKRIVSFETLAFSHEKAG